MDKMPGKVKECRICGGEEFSEILDLGDIPPVDNFIEGDEKAESYPLKLMICENCDLVQLSYVVPKEKLFNSDYAYDMSVTDEGVKHFHEMADELDAKYPDHDSVVDIGSNTGVLLEGFISNGWEVLGVEPSQNIYEKAREKGIPTINKFFSEKTAEGVVENHREKDLVTATNVFAHVDDLHDFLNGVKTLLKQDGVFVFEVPYLKNLLEKNEFDTIYHEHLSYFSVKPLRNLFGQHGMAIIDIEPQKIHGGSLRIHVANEGEYEKTETVQRYVEREETDSIHSIENLENFRERVKEIREELKELIDELSSKGKTIAGIGAPAKGVVLLNYYSLDKEKIPYVSEKSDIKIGKKVPGTRNKVVSDQTLIERNPDYALLLPWNFSDTIMENLDEYIENGGKIIIPVPEPRIVQD